MFFFLKKISFFLLEISEKIDLSLGDPIVMIFFKNTKLKYYTDIHIS